MEREVGPLEKEREGWKRGGEGVEACKQKGRGRGGGEGWSREGRGVEAFEKAWSVSIWYY